MSVETQDGASGAPGDDVVEAETGQVVARVLVDTVTMFDDGSDGVGFAGLPGVCCGYRETEFRAGVPRDRFSEPDAFDERGMPDGAER